MTVYITNEINLSFFYLESEATISRITPEQLVDLTVVSHGDINTITAVPCISNPHVINRLRLLYWEPLDECIDFPLSTDKVHPRPGDTVILVLLVPNDSGVLLIRYNF